MLPLDLIQEIQLRLPYNKFGYIITFFTREVQPICDLDNLELTNSGFSIPTGFWRTTFIRTYGASLPNEVDYELEYKILTEMSEIKLLHYLIRKRYNDVLKVRLPKTDFDRILVEASKYGNIDVVKFLLDNGVTIYPENNLALRWAAHGSHYDIFKLLMSRGATMNVKRMVLH